MTERGTFLRKLAFWGLLVCAPILVFVSSLSFEAGQYLASFGLMALTYAVLIVAARILYADIHAERKDRDGDRKGEEEARRK
jgi:membrane protein DedA with SNARE-associated domain